MKTFAAAIPALVCLSPQVVRFIHGMRAKRAVSKEQQ